MRAKASRSRTRQRLLRFRTPPHPPAIGIADSDLSHTRIDKLLVSFDSEVRTRVCCRMRQLRKRDTSEARSGAQGGFMRTFNAGRCVEHCSRCGVCLLAVPIFPQATLRSLPPGAAPHLLGLDRRAARTSSRVDANAGAARGRAVARRGAQRAARRRIAMTVSCARPTRGRICRDERTSSRADQAARAVAGHLVFILTRPPRSLDVVVGADAPAPITQRRYSAGSRRAVDPVVERRVHELGTVEPLIPPVHRPQSCTFPGLDNPQRLIDILVKTAKLAPPGRSSFIPDRMTPRRPNRHPERSGQGGLALLCDRESHPVAGEGPDRRAPGFDQRPASRSSPSSSIHAPAASPRDAVERRPAVRHPVDMK